MVSSVSLSVSIDLPFDTPWGLVYYFKLKGCFQRRKVTHQIFTKPEGDPAEESRGKAENQVEGQRGRDAKNSSEAGNGLNPHPGGKVVLQMIWGVALVLAGVGVFYRTLQVIPRVETIAQSSSEIGLIRFSFYLLGILLIWGGVRKIYHCHKGLRGK